MATNGSEAPVARWMPLVLAGAAILGLLALAWTVLPDGGAQNAASARVGGAFHLQSSAGGIVDSTAVVGKPFLVTFGFTRCPSTCPTTLAEITNLIDGLQKDGMTIDAYLVTVDPERDTTDALREYLTSFSDRIIGLTGSVDDIQQVARLYRAFVQKVPLKDGDYTFEHTTSVYLMDGRARFVAPLDLGNAFDRGAAEVRRVLAQTASNRASEVVKTP